MLSNFIDCTISFSKYNTTDAYLATARPINMTLSGCMLEGVASVRAEWGQLVLTGIAMLSNGQALCNGGSWCVL
jgi:hypothetical protein